MVAQPVAWHMFSPALIFSLLPGRCGGGSRPHTSASGNVGRNESNEELRVPRLFPFWKTFFFGGTEQDFTIISFWFISNTLVSRLFTCRCTNTHWRRPRHLGPSKCGRRRIYVLTRRRTRCNETRQSVTLSSCRERGVSSGPAPRSVCDLS